MTTTYDLRGKSVVGLYFGTPFTGVVREVRPEYWQRDTVAVHVDAQPFLHGTYQRTGICLSVNRVTGRDDEYRCLIVGI